MEAYRSSIDEIIKKYATDAKKGLSEREAQKRLQQVGLNKLPEKKKRSWIVIFLRQYKSPLIYLLLVAATIIFFVSDPLDAVVISVILLFNAIIGMIQEGRTERMLEGLKQYLKLETLVIRDGKQYIIATEKVVSGDIIVVQEGERVPGDARLIEVNNIYVDESMLTGESEPVEKSEKAIKIEASIADQSNMLFCGTYILSGSGKALVVATGESTSIGKIGKIAEEIVSDMPLKREIDALSHYIVYCILFSCIILFLIGLWQKRSFVELLILLSALFVCVVPEGLPVIMTLTLATGARRMAENNVIVKRLQAAEGLGRTDILIIDKTGTLTRNEMLVSRIATENQTYAVAGRGYHVEGKVYSNDKPIEGSEKDLLEIGEAISLLCKAEIQYVKDLGTFKIKGDPTEAALHIFSKKLGTYKKEATETFHVIKEIPFTSQAKYRAGLYRKDDLLILFIIGAPEVVMQRSESISATLKKSFEQMLSEGLRVVACAKKEMRAEKFSEQELHDQAAIENMLNDNFSFLGFIGIEDSMREDVLQTVQEAHNAGLKVVMATGDHKDTALFIAKKAGIFHEGDTVVDGLELAALSDKKLYNKIDSITVFSRVTPEDKVRIVRAYQQKGNIVAMTGDGVNDAPSLMAADVGIAMGGIGTEIAKEVADIILQDDLFSSIVHAIKQGRYIFYSLRRVISYFFTTNIAEVLIILFALLLYLPLPLVTVQILWLNLVTDGFLDVALSLEPLHEKLARIKQLVHWKMLINIFYLSAPMAIGSLWIFYLNNDNSLILARTMALVSMALYQWFNAWNCRSEKFSIFHIGIFSNKWLIGATVIVFLLQCLMLYTKPMQSLFKTVPISGAQWMLIFAITAPLFLGEELRKTVMNYRSR